MVACVYILLVLIPVLRPSHIRELPRDFMYAGLLYSLPLGGGGGRIGVRLDGRVPARPRHRRRLHHARSPAPTRAMIMFLLVVLFVIVGDFIDAVPGDHHLHADHHASSPRSATSTRCTWAW